MTTYVSVPTGTPKGFGIGLNGAFHLTCEGDNGRCYELQQRPLTYYDAEGNETTDICNAASVDLPVCTPCGCETVCLLVPEEVAALEAGTNVFAAEYPNDGSEIPPLAPAGDILVGQIAATAESCSFGYWDNVAPTAPAGFGYVNVKLVGFGASIAAAA